MQFIDKTKIKLVSGRGGNGMVAWRREKYVEKVAQPEVTVEMVEIYILSLIEDWLLF